MVPFGLPDFQFAYEISPILLTGGIAANMPGGALPIVSITEANNYASLLTGGAGLAIEDYFAHYQPLPGATLIDQDLGNYPFANQQTAANAVIAKPLVISLMMICPARGSGGYANKLPVLSALQAALTQHNISGGTYAIATPAWFWIDAIMLGMRDVTSADTAQVQLQWQMDFIKPLITQADAAAAQNTLLSKISSGTMLTNPSWSGQQPGIGNPSSGLAPPIVPASQPSPTAGPALSQGGLGISSPTGP